MICFSVHLFTQKEGQTTSVTIGYMPIDHFHEKGILQNGFSHIQSRLGTEQLIFPWNDPNRTLG